MLTELLAVVSNIPLTERGRIDLPIHDAKISKHHMRKSASITCENQHASQQLPVRFQALT